MALADSKQLIILKALTAQIEATPGITVVMPGDPTMTEVPYSLVGAVFRGRVRFGDELSGMPFIAILEAKRPDANPPEAGSDYLLRDEDWHLLIQGFMQDHDDTPTDALYRLKAAVEQQLSQIVAEDQSSGQPEYPSVYRLGGLIMDMRIGPGVVRPYDISTGNVEAFFLPVMVRFAMNVASPFDTTL